MLFLITLEEVLSLDEKTFEEHPRKFVKFFAPWCGHCKQLAPIWMELANEISSVDIVEVDCTVEKNLCNRFDVKGFPTLKMFMDGVVTNYEGARSKAALHTWIDSMTLPQFQYRTIEQCHEENKARNVEQFFVLFTNELENADYTFFKGKITICTVQAETKKFVAYRDGDAIEFTGSTTQESLQAFVDTNKLSYLPELSSETYGQLSKKNITVLVVNPTTQVEKVKELRAAIKNMKTFESFNVAWMDGVHWEKYIETFKPHSIKDYPFVLVINPGDDTKYWSRLLKEEDKPSDVMLSLMEEIEKAEEKPKLKDEL